MTWFPLTFLRILLHNKVSTCTCQNSLHVHVSEVHIKASNRAYETCRLLQTWKILGEVNDYNLKLYKVLQLVTPELSSLIYLYTSHQQIRRFKKYYSYIHQLFNFYIINLRTIGSSRSSLLKGTHTYMQIKYSYIYTDTYTTNNYNLITKTNIMKQQQQYTKQTTNTVWQKTIQ